ncbi:MULTISPECIES: NADPH-dependent F420 reductase [Paraburkholderia]|uniref:NADPH-dependent F420 reductase n=1 Tax=Paraburkholderia TaxID=1822464 RepID=UPI00225762CA|nr:MULTISPECIES: NADPH-dependent F420 reductase [Paraburkholderia]MCX4164250.1 NADPH-dependent F420 reductase [Paraburkholderia megapolitana]MDN7159744.1 NADPH-dependent F420 reductase [Paraburkholderia sp. CHISQ3]MDQ6496791.1 NADPH-dependent F420 reductase [Paraburkholderia megapolitana]
MKVAIIGSGNMGAGLARALTAANIPLVIGHHDPAKAAALAGDLGSQVQGGGIAAAVKLADVVILALPYQAIAEVLGVAGDLSGKILVDISNPISADFKSLVVGHTTSAAEQIQSIAPQARVVKAFNTIFAGLLAADARKGKTLQVFVASDDDTAKREVSQLANAIGFEPVDAGPLSNSRFIEPIGEMNIHFGFFLGWGPVTAPAWIKV